MFSGRGQINMDSAFGKEIYNICKRKNINNIFEVGTWNGEGSTVCVMNAIVNKPNSILYSLEADKNQYNRARVFWDSKQTNNKLVLLNGVLHKEYASEEEIRRVLNGQFPYIQEHYVPEKNMLNNNELINISDINNVDAIILDGGEYTTQGDYNTLIKKYPKIIILDDVSVYKCMQIRKTLLNNSEWLLYKEDLKDRHGWSIFYNKTYTDE